MTFAAKRIFRYIYPMGTSKSGTAVLLVVSVLIAFCGCRAKPAPDAGFLQDPKLMNADKNLPFNRMFMNPKFRDRNYTEIYVAPVNTNYVLAENIWEKATFAESNKLE